MSQTLSWTHLGKFFILTVLFISKPSRDRRATLCFLLRGLSCLFYFLDGYCAWFYSHPTTKYEQNKVSVNLKKKQVERFKKKRVEKPPQLVWAPDQNRKIRWAHYFRRKWLGLKAQNPPSRAAAMRCPSSSWADSRRIRNPSPGGIPLLKPASLTRREPSSR